MDWARRAAGPRCWQVLLLYGETVSASFQQQKKYFFIAHHYMFLAKLITGVDLVFGSTELHRATLMLNVTLWLYVSYVYGC